MPPVTRSLLLTIFLLTITNFVLRPPFQSAQPSWASLTAPFVRVGLGAPYLSIVPGVSITYPWVFLTATFVEQNLVGLIISSVALYYGGRYLERAYGSQEFLVFLLFAAMIPNLFSFGMYILFYGLTRNKTAL